MKTQDAENQMTSRLPVRAHQKKKRNHKQLETLMNWKKKKREKLETIERR